MFSIDQNCHSLWDVIPKLSALTARGHKVRHFVEDVDVAFTSMGSGLQGEPLRLCRERFYPSGGQDWGAALFYSDYLGKLPLELRDLEPVTGMKTGALAKKLRRTVDDLYEEFSPADNWQLIGPSYVGDRQHHRTVADLSVAETTEFIGQIMGRARAGMLAMFPGKVSQQRLLEWFGQEESTVAELLQKHARGRLVHLYSDWLKRYLGDSMGVGLTSELFACNRPCAGNDLLELFCRDYALMAGLYNDALAEADSALRPLRTSIGELPFFATCEHQNHAVRVGLNLRGQELQAGRYAFKLTPQRTPPFDRMAAAGIHAVVGKAVMLVIQVRMGAGGAALALPYRGSLYLPAADVLAGKLVQRGLIDPELRPVVRVRFRLLERMQEVDTIIRLPDHLAGYFGKDEMPAKAVGEACLLMAKEAQGRSRAFRDPSARQQWQERNFSGSVRRLAELDLRRRRMIEESAPFAQTRDIWEQIKSLQADLLDKMVRQIVSDYQASELDYWDSRGPLLPVSIALGGMEFYDDLIARAEIYEEAPAGEIAPKGDRACAIEAHYHPRISPGRENFEVLDWGHPDSQEVRFRVLAENVSLEGKSILDVGSGLGDLLSYLKQRKISVHYTGVDIVASMVAAAQARHPDGNFICGDIFSDETLLSKRFDVVFSSGIFNLNLGNNLLFLPKAIARMLRYSSEYVVFNCLHHRVAPESERYFCYDPDAVRKMLEPSGCEFRILDDYWPSDFTVICRQ